MATIVEVARQAGVSTSTVSHVINGTRTVAESTRERVESAITETGYRQNSIARAMRRSRTDSIGLVVSDAAQPAFAEMTRGGESETANAGQVLLLANSGESPEREVRALRALAARRVDGLVVAPVGRSTHDEVQAIRRHGTPVVILDRIGHHAHGDRVGVENSEPMRDLVLHLVEHGCRRIALASGDTAVPTIAERADGYRKGLRLSGIEHDRGLEVEGPGLASDTRTAALDLLRAPDRPDAIVCVSTETCVGVLEAARDLGLSIPKDFRLVSFDEFPHADLFEPQITAVRQPAFELGATAMRLLQRRIDALNNAEEEEEDEVIRLAPKIVHRTSCGCPPRSR